MLPQFAFLRRIAEPTPFLPPFFPPPEVSSFWETSIAITPARTQKVLPTPVGRKYSIGSSFLTSSTSMTLTYLLFSIPHLAVAPPLLPPDISFAPSSLALSCSWEVLANLGSDHLPILLTVPLSPVFRPNESLLSFNFQTACWDDFAFYFDSHCPSAEKYLSLSSTAALFTSLTLNALLSIWCRQTVLFLFLLAKTALAYLPTALSLAQRPPFLFSRPSMLKFFATACAILQALFWARQHQQV